MTQEQMEQRAAKAKRLTPIVTMIPIQDVLRNRNLPYRGNERMVLVSYEDGRVVRECVKFRHDGHLGAVEG